MYEKLGVSLVWDLRGMHPGLLEICLASASGQVLLAKNFSETWKWAFPRFLSMEKRFVRPDFNFHCNYKQDNQNYTVSSQFLNLIGYQQADLSTNRTVYTSHSHIIIITRTLFVITVQYMTTCIWQLTHSAWVTIVGVICMHCWTVVLHSS